MKNKNLIYFGLAGVALFFVYKTMAGKKSGKSAFIDVERPETITEDEFNEPVQSGGTIQQAKETFETAADAAQSAADVFSRTPEQKEAALAKRKARRQKMLTTRQDRKAKRTSKKAARKSKRKKTIGEMDFI